MWCANTGVSVQHPCPRISSYLALQSSRPSVFPSLSPTIHFPKSSQMILKTNLMVHFPKPFPLASEALWVACPLPSSLPSDSSQCPCHRLPSSHSGLLLLLSACQLVLAFEPLNSPCLCLKGSAPIFTQLAPDLPFWAPLKCHSSEIPSFTTRLYVSSL